VLLSAVCPDRAPGGGRVYARVMRVAFVLVPAIAMALVVACAPVVPPAAANRCKLGMSDGNDEYTARQGAACRVVAQSLVSDDQPNAAVSFARKACDLQDAAGCVLYLTLARGQASELSRARSTGEKACDGMVVSADGTDPRPRLCFLTGELYDELEPRSPSDAGRLYARACKLGDDRGCPRATSLGVDPNPPPPVATKPASRPAPTAVPAPPPTSTVVTQVLAPACHEMRGCVALDVQQRNSNEVVGTVVNHCDHSVVCRWCPAHATQVEKTLCHSGTLSAGESRTGTQWGLWYQGYDAMAYDCIDEHDPQGCLAL
jgi:hypothetical protein